VIVVSLLRLCVVKTTTYFAANNVFQTQNGNGHPFSASGPDQDLTDEFHVVFDTAEDPKRRPEMLELSRLHAATTQIVYLTGTLPPREMDVFF